MTLVYSFYIPHNESLDEIIRICTNLYNQSLYLERQEYKNSGKFISYCDLDKIIKKTTNLEGTITYKLLKAQVAQQVLRVLEKDYKSYFSSIKDYKRNPKKYNGIPLPPGYKNKGSLSVATYTNQVSKIKDDGFIYLSKTLKIKNSSV